MTDVETQETAELPSDVSGYSTSSSSENGAAPGRRRRGRPPKLDATTHGPDGAPVAAEPAAARPRAQRASRRTTEDRIAAMRGKIEEQFAMGGILLLPVSPVTGTVMIRRSATFTDHVCALCAHDARVLKIMERVVATSVWADVAMMGGTLAIAIAVDRGLIRHDTMVAAMVGPEITEVLSRQAAARAQAPDVATADAA